MRKFQQQQILDVIISLHTLHKQIKDRMEHGDYHSVQTALVDCQDAAIQVGEAIEQIEGEGNGAVFHLEQYCENVYQGNMQMLTYSGQKLYKFLENSLVKAENEVKHMPIKLEAVFLPYKASMWDSLESVWMAAQEALDCETYVIPIPYYDRNSDGSFGTEHYEGDAYPDYVPVTHYSEYDFAVHRPDMVFIHNPYDQYNNVTSIHPFFYSKNLKKYTDSLVYIPYYCTSGGMSEAQRQCIAYYYADYIVIQAEKYRKFFDENLPQEKLLPLGSPKFDKVIRLCKNPPQPPEKWKEKMAGKKVYFYNTSIAGMLGDTEAFLRKMEYVFRSFAGRNDTCLLWRPHPLLESTFDSLRVEYKPIYEKLKEYFLVSGLGIYDDTSEIEPTIALCDAYVGDAGSSVVSVFGIVGKPIFILNNNIHSIPGEDDWRGEIIQPISRYANDKWMITQGSKLYHSMDCSEGYQFRYYCDLSEYACVRDYLEVVSVCGKDYACPLNAQSILVIGSKGIEKKIDLQHLVEGDGAFYGAVGCGQYLFLIPNEYPAVVRYDVVSGEIDYLKENLDVFIRIVQGNRYIGGFCAQGEYLFIASPTDNQVLAIHARTGQEKILTIDSPHSQGSVFLCSDGTSLWSLPYFGCAVTQWNPESGEVHVYTECPPRLQCRHPVSGHMCMERPFSHAVFYDRYVYLMPYWGNMYVMLDTRSGEMTEWVPPFEKPESWKNGYYTGWCKSYFIRSIYSTSGRIYRIESHYDRKIYDINFATKEYREVPIEFSMDDLRENEMGFWENSRWLAYACQENAFNSLPDFLDGRITGHSFDRDKEICAYGEITANYDGTSGEKIYSHVRKSLAV